MIYEFSLHLHLAESELHVGQFFNVDLPGKLVHCYGEIWCFHRFGENFTKAGTGTVKTQNPNFVFVIVYRLKKRQPVDMVPMSMSNQQRKLDWLRPKFLFQSNSKRADTRAGVDYDDLAVCANFNATRVAAVANGGRAWNRN